MATYQLDTLDDSFSLALKDKNGNSLEFAIKYPNTEEMRTIVRASGELEDLIDRQEALTKDTTVSKEVKAAEFEKTQKEIEEVSKKSEESLNALITPVGHESPFSEVFQNQSIRVQREFRKIIQKEFAGTAE